MMRREPNEQRNPAERGQPPQPPPVPTVMPVQPRKPRWIAALGVINIVFGSLGVVCCGLNTMVLGMLPVIIEEWDLPFLRDPQTAEQLRKAIDTSWYWTYQIASSGVAMASSALLIVGGVGLLKRMGWGRHLSIAGAVIFLITQVADEIAKAAAHLFDPMGICVAVAALVYPIVMLAFLLPRHRAAWFGPRRIAPPGWGPPPAPP